MTKPTKTIEKKNATRQTSTLSAHSLTFHTPAQLNGAIPGRLVVLKPQSTFKLRDPLGVPALPVVNSESSQDSGPTTPDAKPIRSFSLNSYDKLIRADSLHRRYARRPKGYGKSRSLSTICCGSGISSQRPCVCLVPLMFALGIVCAFGLYFGLRGFSMLERPFEKVFRGSFKVTAGDAHVPELSDPTSDHFLTKAQQYEVRIEDALRSNKFKESAIHAEVVSFDRDDEDHLSVIFNLFVDTRKVAANATSIRRALEKSAIRPESTDDSADPSPFEGLALELHSIEIKERDVGAIVEDFTTTMNKRPPSLYHTRYHKDNEVSESRACVPVSLPFCKTLGYNYTTFPNVIGFRTPRDVENVLETATAESLNSPNRRMHAPNPQIYRINNEVSQAVKELLQCSKLPKDDSTCQVTAPPIERQKETGPPFKGQQGGSGPVRGLQEGSERIRGQPSRNGPIGGELGGVRPSEECMKDLTAKNLESRMCDGVMDCADFSDEMECGYCQPGFVHCGVGASCIDPSKRCNGVVDCPNGSDERACLMIAPSMEAASYIHQYFSDGFVVFNEGDKMGKICADLFNQSVTENQMEAFLDIFGESTCKQLTYRYMVDITAVRDDDREDTHSYAQLTDSGRWRASFLQNPCLSNSVLRLKCAELECGIRPIRLKSPPSIENRRQAVPKRSQDLKATHGDWPWQSALLKDGMHVCDGTLVSDVWILTSQSCFENSPRANWVARFATVRTSSVSPWEQEKRIIGMVRSPLPGSGIVLAKLDSPVIFSDFVRPTCLGYEGMRLDRNTKCVVLTWDLQGEELEEESVRLTSPEVCMSASRTNSSRILSMCAENAVQSRTCKTEAFNGAPLLCQESQQGAWSLVGVATSYQRCRPGLREPTSFKGKPYESIALLADWVVRTIRVTRPFSS